MPSSALFFAALSLLYSVNAQGNPQPIVQPNPNSPVLVIQPNPNAPVVAVPAAPTKVERDANGCQIYGTTWSQGAKCAVTGCYGYNTLSCDNITTTELSNNLDLYSKQKPFTEANFQPLYLTVSNSALNFTQSNFNTTSGPVSSWIRRLDLINTDIGANIDDAFNGLVNMSQLRLDRVPVESMGKATFDNLPALRNVYLSNLPKLRKIDSGFVDPLVALDFDCLTIDLTTADSLTCDCTTVKYVQNYRKRILAISQLGTAAKKTVPGTNTTCDINIVCQSGSQKVNMKDANTDELCKVQKTELAVTTPKSAGNPIINHGNYPILLISLFVFLSAAIAM